MPREPRKRFPKTWYHVMNKGLNKQDIFLSDDHRKVFISLLKKVVTKYQVEIHAYCLMTNHYHIIIRTNANNISQVMRYINGTFSQFFNFTQKRTGPLLQGRFKSTIINDKQYLLELSRYIHQNPTKAGIVQHPLVYEWSSYIYFVKKIKSPDWLTTSKTLEIFDEIYPDKKTKYAEFVESKEKISLRELIDKHNTLSKKIEKMSLDEQLKYLQTFYLE